jgi:predicted O-methyltransferase YrrM
MSNGDPVAAFLKDMTPSTFFDAVKRVIFGRHDGPANIDYMSKLAAAVSSAQYALLHMQDKPRFRNRSELLTFALSEMPNKGLILEFGVHTGISVNFIADRVKDRQVYGFDSFQGLPEDWTENQKKGHFAVEQLPAVRRNVELVPGWFDQTLPTFAQERSDKVAFLHVDCDLYSSTKTIFDNLNTHIVPGTIIVFDEYLNYLRWELYEYKAFQEFCQRNCVQYEYIGLVPTYYQVAVRITQRDESRL